jgi:hypothetical protein
VSARYDNAAARDLAAQLPLTLTFRDVNHVEKIAPLPREVSLGGVPEGDDSAVGDIGYWAPGGDLVFYYGDVGFRNGIVRLGELDGGLDASSTRAGTSTSRSAGQNAAPAAAAPPLHLVDEGQTMS